MVGEFPELQGIMGRYYAIAGGEDTAVADAVRDHYQPLGPAADVPTAPISIVAALADKLDTLNEFFRINEKPTGSKDPYALRRAALGVIRIILENNIRLPLSEFARADVLDFIKDRLKFYLKDQNLPNDICAAVLTTSDDLFLTRAKAFALQQLITSQDGKNLLALTKRASNILKIEEKKDDKSYKGVVKTDLFRSGEEETLFQVLAKLEIQVAEDIKKEEYVWAAQHLAKSKSYLDAFFDKTLVNDADAKVRENRLNLLGQIRKVFEQFADFSQLEG